MRKLIIWILGLFPVRRDKQSSVLQDLLDNDHQYCKVCGDLFHTIKKQQIYCSKTCRVLYHNSLRKKK